MLTDACGVLEYQTAVMRRGLDTSDKVLVIPREQRTPVAHFHEKRELAAS